MGSDKKHPNRGNRKNGQQPPAPVTRPRPPGLSPEQREQLQALGFEYVGEREGELVARYNRDGIELDVWSRSPEALLARCREELEAAKHGRALKCLCGRPIKIDRTEAEAWKQEKCSGCGEPSQVCTCGPLISAKLAEAPPEPSSSTSWAEREEYERAASLQEALAESGGYEAAAVLVPPGSTVTVDAAAALYDCTPSSATSAASTVEPSSSTPGAFSALRVVVHGEEFELTAPPCVHLWALIRRALNVSKNWERPPLGWCVRNEAGEELNPKRTLAALGLRNGDRVWLAPAGVGGDLEGLPAATDVEKLEEVLGQFEEVNAPAGGATAEPGPTGEPAILASCNGCTFGTTDPALARDHEGSTGHKMRRASLPGSAPAYIRPAGWRRDSLRASMLDAMEAAAHTAEVLRVVVHQAQKDDAARALGVVEDAEQVMVEARENAALFRRMAENYATACRLPLDAVKRWREDTGRPAVLLARLMGRDESRRAGALSPAAVLMRSSAVTFLATGAIKAAAAELRAAREEVARSMVPTVEGIAARTMQDGDALRALAELAALPEGAEVPAHLVELRQALANGTPLELLREPAGQTEAEATPPSLAEFLAAAADAAELLAEAAEGAEAVARKDGAATGAKLPELLAYQVTRARREALNLRFLVRFLEILSRAPTPEAAWGEALAPLMLDRRQVPDDLDAWAKLVVESDGETGAGDEPAPEVFDWLGGRLYVLGWELEGWDASGGVWLARRKFLDASGVVTLQAPNADELLELVATYNRRAAALAALVEPLGSKPDSADLDDEARRAVEARGWKLEGYSLGCGWLAVRQFGPEDVRTATGPGLGELGDAIDRINAEFSRSQKGGA